MDAKTLIERIDREIQEQDAIVAALHEALSSCDPELRFAIRATDLPDVPRPPGPTERAGWFSLVTAALHRSFEHPQ